MKTASVPSIFATLHPSWDLLCPRAERSFQIYQAGRLQVRSEEFDSNTNGLQWILCFSRQSRFVDPVPKQHSLVDQKDHSSLE